MRVNVGPIKGRKGACVEIDIAERMKAPWDDNVVFVEPVYGSAKVTNTGRGFYATGTAKVTARIACDRCLEPYVAELAAEFEQAFREPGASGRRPTTEEKDEAEGEEEREVPAPDDESRPYDGDTIDLTETVSEAFLLAAPVKFVCREDCKGICPMCGVNRNVSECSCASPAIDPRLAALAKLLEKNGHDRK